MSSKDATAPVYSGPRRVLDPWDGIPRFSSVAVVGNSGRLAGAGAGEEIDAHAAVIRMNAAPTDGYEVDVGRRTTFRFINGLLQQGKTLEYTSTPAKWIEGLRDHRVILMPMRSQTVVDRATAMIHGSNTVHHLTDEFKAYMDRLKAVLGNPPSSGVHCLSIATQLSDTVRAYGFGFHQEELADRHYWEQWSGAHDASHSWKRERRVVGSLVDRHGIQMR